MFSNNILIIDDEDQFRKLLNRVISLEGFHTREANTLRSGQAILEKDSIDIVLCDVKLPDGNGVDFIRQIKAINQSIEVILLTAYGNIEDGVQAMRNGAYDYITKANDNKVNCFGFLKPATLQKVTKQKPPGF